MLLLLACLIYTLLPGSWAKPKGHSKSLAAIYSHTNQKVDEDIKDFCWTWNWHYKMWSQSLRSFNISIHQVASYSWYDCSGLVSLLLFSDNFLQGNVAQCGSGSTRREFWLHPGSFSEHDRHLRVIIFGIWLESSFKSFVALRSLYTWKCEERLWKPGKSSVWSSVFGVCRVEDSWMMSSQLPK